MSEKDDFVKVGDVEVSSTKMPSRTQQLKDIWLLSYKPMFGGAMIPVFNLLNTAACGALNNPKYLAAYGLGTSVLAIFAVGTIVQLTSLQTVIGQANGEKNYRLARIYLHR